MRFTNLILAAATLASAALAYRFDTMLIVLFENTRFEEAMDDPNFKRFANQGVFYSNWSAIGHPSRPNYVYLSSGSTYGIDSDSLIVVNAKNIVDLLEQKQLTWRSYEEGFPGNCFNQARSGHWAEKHSLVMEFADVRNDPRRCANVVEASQFIVDIRKKRIPNYAMYTPDLNDDGHDTGVTFAGEWLRKFLKQTEAVKHFDVVMLTFDESSPDNNQNHIYTAIQGKAVANPGTVDNTPLSHASVLKTLELNWGLKSLNTNDTHAIPFTVW